MKRKARKGDVLVQRRGDVVAVVVAEFSARELLVDLGHPAFWFVRGRAEFEVVGRI